MATVRNIVLMKEELTDVVAELDTHLKKTAGNAEVKQIILIT